MPHADRRRSSVEHSRKTAGTTARSIYIRLVKGELSVSSPKPSRRKTATSSMRLEVQTVIPASWRPSPSNNTTPPRRQPANANGSRGWAEQTQTVVGPVTQTERARNRGRERQAEDPERTPIAVVPRAGPAAPKLEG